MGTEWQVRLTGTGGQGLIFAGQVLAEAAGLYDRLHVVQTQSYGPEARGGASRADVIISDSDILYPEVLEADVLLCLSQQAFERYFRAVKASGLVIYDPLFVCPPANERVHLLPVPASETADRLGNRVVANIVALGALVGATGIVRPSSLREAVRARAPRKSLDLNLSALELGLALGRPAETDFRREQ